MNIDDDAPPLPTIISNAVLAIVAGSDTTSNVLSGVMYYLLLYPDYTKRLRHELNMAFPPSEHAGIELDRLANLELLNAIMFVDKIILVMLYAEHRFFSFFLEMKFYGYNLQFLRVYREPQLETAEVNSLETCTSFFLNFAY